jgi:hypothetical protein
MKTRAALALSVAGILLTGGAAFATTQTLSHTGSVTSDDAQSVLVTDDSATRTPAPAVGSAKATAKTTDDRQADDKKASAAKKASKPAEAGDDKGGTVAAPAQNFVGSGSISVEPGDDKGGLRTTAEPGDDNGGLRSDQAPRVAERGDDHGGLRTTPEAGDDKGGDHKATDSGDDTGGSGGHGSDD